MALTVLYSQKTLFLCAQLNNSFWFLLLKRRVVRQRKIQKERRSWAQTKTLQVQCNGQWQAFVEQIPAHSVWNLTITVFRTRIHCSELIVWLHFHAWLINKDHVINRERSNCPPLHLKLQISSNRQVDKWRESSKPVISGVFYNPEHWIRDLLKLIMVREQRWQRVLHMVPQLNDSHRTAAGETLVGTKRLLWPDCLSPAIRTRSDSD